MGEESNFNFNYAEEEDQQCDIQQNDYYNQQSFQQAPKYETNGFTQLMNQLNLNEVQIVVPQYEIHNNQYYQPYQ